MPTASAMHQKCAQAQRPTGGRGEAWSERGRDEARASRQDQTHWGPEDLLGQALAQQNMAAAWESGKANKGSAGVDGCRVEKRGEDLKTQWSDIRRSLLDGTYRPSPVRRVGIPKPGGGTRELGIPTVVDRLIQQALLQVLQPRIDPTFSEHSYGFRPGRSAHQAVQAARQYVEQGRRVVVDLDLEKFFDRVNHDILMDRLAKRIADKAVLRLIRHYLNTGIMAHGVVQMRVEGTPQGGPLSSPQASASSPCSSVLASITSLTLPAVPRTVCTRPESASTPMWAFMPKYHWLPFLLCFICGSRSPEVFLVELGAAISVASTTVPARSSTPLALSNSLMSTRICGASLCSSSRRRNRRIVVSSGTAVSQFRPANSRNSGTSCSASSSAGSLSVNHCCMKWMRSIVSTANGGRPRLPSQAYRAISATNAAHGTTRSISARNSRLRVRFVVRFRPRSACFMAQIFSAQGTRQPRWETICAECP